MRRMIESLYVEKNISKSREVHCMHTCTDNTGKNFLTEMISPRTLARVVSFARLSGNSRNGFFNASVCISVWLTPSAFVLKKNTWFICGAVENLQYMISYNLCNHLHLISPTIINIQELRNIKLFSFHSIL